MARPMGARTHRKVMCELCGKRMRPDRMAKHMQRAHPDGHVDARDRAKIQAWRMQKRRAAAARAAVYVVPIIIIILLITVYMVFFYKPPSGPSGPGAGDKAPDVVLTDTQGILHNLSKDDYGHHYIFLEFFSTQCAHCQNVATPLTWLYANYSDQMVFYSIAPQNNEETLQWQAEHGATWSHFSDPNDATFTKFVPDVTKQGVPHMYLIDKNGYIRDDFSGDQNTGNGAYDSQGAYDSLDARVKNLLTNY